MMAVKLNFKYVNNPGWELWPLRVVKRLGHPHMTELNPCSTSYVAWSDSKLYNKLLWVSLHPKVYALKRRCGTTVSHVLHWANKLPKVWHIGILYPDWWALESAYPEFWPCATYVFLDIAPMLYDTSMVQAWRQPRYHSFMEYHQWAFPITSSQNQRTVGGNLWSPPNRNISIQKWLYKWMRQHWYLLF